MKFTTNQHPKSTRVPIRASNPIAGLPVQDRKLNPDLIKTLRKLALLAAHQAYLEATLHRRCMLARISAYSHDVLRELLSAPERSD